MSGRLRELVRPWFHLGRRESLEKRKEARDAAVFISSLVLAVVFGVLPMPVVWKWLGWFLCFWGVVYIVRAVVNPINRLPARTTRIGLVILLIAFIVGCWPTAHAQWREEKAAALSGELCSFRSFWGTCYTPPIPIIEIGGDSDSQLVYMGAEDSVDFGKFARNAGLRIERGKHGMEITTPVLDRSGKKIANVEKNHWTVISQPGIWDKNYTDNALEIKDSRGDVVLQLRFLPDRLQIAAEWRDQFGRGQEWAKCSAPGKPASGCIIPWGNAQTELQNEVAIEPIFKYPSSEQWGEFVKK